jgi:hypothetical protein
MEAIVTIAVIWQEDNVLWCAADTRIVVDPNKVVTDIAAKIYAIPVVVAALDTEGEPREPHYRAQYGFVYAGAVAPATVTAITSSTFLQKLVRGGDKTSPPTFEQIAELVHRLAVHFMKERRAHGGDGIFAAAFFGWCPHTSTYKVAYINGRDDGSFRVELSYPSAPESEGSPWLVLGSGAAKFRSELSAYLKLEDRPITRAPFCVIDKMVSEGQEPSVGGSKSIAFAHKDGLELCLVAGDDAFTRAGNLKALSDQPQPIRRPMFNGLDLETDVGFVGAYEVQFYATVL